uniref:Uncharacterized protein n=1 Tax=Rhizophora mucronata TaxID=61149 RepID=A0A2P2Q5F4_RHIMU
MEQKVYNFKVPFLNSPFISKSTVKQSKSNKKKKRKIFQAIFSLQLN